MEPLFAGALFAYEDEEPQAELRGIMAYSGSGRLYVVGDDGKIKAADVRQQLLSGAWAQGGAAGTAPPPSLRTITASPPLELTAAHCGLNRSGTYAAVAGSALEDPEISRVVVIDLANCRPAPGSPASGGAARHDLCDAVVLDAELFASRPGLRVLQVGWHPDSDAHLAVLTSGEPGACCRCRPPVARGDDNTWRLYNTQHAGLAEQTFELQLRSRRGLGLGGAGSGAGGAGRAAVAFSFGPPELWQRFSLYFLTGDGSLWCLCPVVPFGCRYSTSTIEQLEGAADAGGSGAGGEVDFGTAPNAQAWLQRAFQLLATPQDPAFGSGMMQSVPHALDEHVPALAGPLPVASAAGEEQREGGSLLTRMAGSGDAAQALLLSRFSEGCTAVAVATARGFLGLHLLAGFGGGAAPAWCESAPQCVSEGLEIQAVRSQVGVVPTGSGQPALLLLDVVNLSLPPPDGASAAAADEDDDGEVLAIGGGTSAASVALLPDAVAPEVLYAVHCSAAHAITLSWLPLLAGLLEEVGGARLPAALPQPAAELLMRSGAGVAAAAAVGDTLSGSALVVLEADGKPRCLRPHRADATAAAGGAGGGGAASAAAASAPAGGSAAQRDVEAQLATIYGDLRKGPKPCELPQAAAGRAAGAGNLEGQRLLNEAAAALRASHVEFAHQAHQDLTERMRQLQAEIDGQRRRLEDAEAAAAAAEQAAAALDAKAARVQQFQGNLGERLRLLAELHWALPRPPSRAERRFADEQLPAFEAAATALEEDARALRTRVSLLQRKLRSVGQVAAGAAALGGGTAAAVLPPHQLRRVREALAEQEQQIGANQQRLSVLEEAAAVAAAVHG
ncbi:hypothetical protein CHLNCDRAFT_49671 [Chlorella variabilis]|uniref:Uncharacterized protein n=1 Tax=Chlorella variabilis TaxID=554065 RepID=E1Z3D0_CHLVA|nr:hypothetical protein CHLNCDRAFT_49671 [Chlorella variabilis]EFN60146.1 hypothetical protein CHLNCDRAFT_49671 [Chlorella variabilis]|eukprot:XP_005852248.1 hypothetical protein CHLNCDRAFT_49671 [Chlorella variabilis]